MILILIGIIFKRYVFSRIIFSFNAIRVFFQDFGIMTHTDGIRNSAMFCKKLGKIHELDYEKIE
jgi:succinate dehydrogenase/fumarate reductase cytochrome b subunit